jgi:hypothetical protein
MPSRSADEIKDRADGGFKSKYITQTNSVSTPIIEQLSEGEHLEYLFSDFDTHISGSIGGM